MVKASDNVFPRLLVSEGGSTTTPAADRVTVYAKADGLLYSKDDAGVEKLMSSGAGGNVATDVIWDAAGDLAVGTGADTAAKLTKGSDLDVLTISASTHVPVWAAPAALSASGDTIADYDTITSETYAAAPGHPGPAVTVTVGSSGILIVGFGGDWTGAAVSGFMSVALSGANTVAATDERAYFGLRKAGVSFLLSGLTSGSTTITAQYRKSAAGDFGRRHLWALAL